MLITLLSAATRPVTLPRSILALALVFVAGLWMAPAALAADAAHSVSAAQPGHGAAATAAAAPVSVIKQFGYSYLVVFMFFLSLVLGSLFLVLLHHLFDAGWSVPVRRFLEHIACLSLPWMAVLFIPIALLAPTIYPWMSLDPQADVSLKAKRVLFNKPMFYVISFGLFGVWGWLAHGLRRQSLAQDKTGSAECTRIMRRYAAGGIFLFAITLTLGAIFWMKSLEHQWFSTMYGVYYFAGSVWTTLATAYAITLWLKRTGPLRDVVQTRQIHDLGVLFFAFTVFYAYIHFSQYFLIWNAAMPEETFWYIKRETGSWWGVCMLLVFGHFFLPFLSLVRIDAKLSYTVMVPMCAWAWFMHYFDMQFNIMPVIHPQGVHISFWDPLCFAGFAVLLGKMFLADFHRHPPFPQRDPRIAEAMGVYVPPATAAAPSPAK